MASTKTMLGKLQKPDGGFTAKASSGALQTKGYGLSIYPQHSKVISAKRITEAHLNAYKSAKASLLSTKGNYFGGWHNPKTGKVYLDISMVTKSQAKAEQLAKKYNQISYYDFAKGKSVKAGGTGKKGRFAKGAGGSTGSSGG